MIFKDNLFVSAVSKHLRSLLALTMLMGVGSSQLPDSLHRVLSSGQLVVISRSSPTTFHETAAGLTGYEYALAKAFAERLGVRLVLREVSTVQQVLQGSAAGSADIGITGTDGLNQAGLQLSEGYLTFREQLICRQGMTLPTSLEKLLEGNLVVAANSTHSRTLATLKKQYPHLRWVEVPDTDELDLLEMVQEGRIDYTIVDSHFLRANKALFPLTQVAFNLGEAKTLRWTLTTTDGRLKQAVDTFFMDSRQNNLLANLESTHLEQQIPLDSPTASKFAERLHTRLPQYEAALFTAAEKNHLDWALLAAVAYQESNWNPEATSPTGVRGFMMLTEQTAHALGVTDRLDPQQSIAAGARYIRQIMDKLPSDVRDEDRLWMTLAAYNLGLGHLEDARRLTDRQGGNPDAWEDVAKRLPMLQNSQYHEQLRHGYARGREALHFVKRVQQYRDTLVRHSELQQRIAALQHKRDKQEHLDQSLWWFVPVRLVFNHDEQTIDSL